MLRFEHSLAKRLALPRDQLPPQSVGERVELGDSQRSHSTREAKSRFHTAQFLRRWTRRQRPTHAAAGGGRGTAAFCELGNEQQRALRAIHADSLRPRTGGGRSVVSRPRQPAQFITARGSEEDSRNPL